MLFQRANYVMRIDDDACNVILESARYTVQFIEVCAVKLLLTKDCFDYDHLNFFPISVFYHKLQ